MSRSSSSHFPRAVSGSKAANHHYLVRVVARIFYNRGYSYTQKRMQLTSNSATGQPVWVQLVLPYNRFGAGRWRSVDGAVAMDFPNCKG